MNIQTAAQRIAELEAELAETKAVDIEEYRHLSRLHEVATERTVQLAAVIERAKRVDNYDESRRYWDMLAILATADTDVALREVRAQAVEDALERFRETDYLSRAAFAYFLEQHAAAVREGRA